MKTRTMLLILSLFVICACSQAPEEKGTGYLTLNISQSTSLKAAGIEIENFTIRISNGNAEVLKLRVGDMSDEIALSAGTYTIEAYSAEFSDPKFETPLYSGKTTVDIEAGETNEASLVCALGNAGIKVVWSDEFSIFSTYYAQIDCNEGHLTYYPPSNDLSTGDKTGYFLPGTVSVFIMADGQNIYGGTITMAAGDIVTAALKLKIEEKPSEGGLSIKISIDETVNNRNVEIVFDPNDTGNQNSGDNSQTNPYTVAEGIAKQNQGENGVWVMGYIVAANTAQNFTTGSTQASVLVLADDAAETNYTKTILVQLQSGSKPRELNLPEHPDNLFQKVAIQGNLATYSSRSGLINTIDYILIN